MQTIAHSLADLCKSVHVPLRGPHREKKNRSPKAPAVQLVVCPDKIDSVVWGRAPRPSKPNEPRQLPVVASTLDALAPRHRHLVETRLAAAPAYALRRGRTVKSRTCARMLDICIPFSCDRYGKTSATNWSSINSRTSSCRFRSPPES